MQNFEYFSALDSEEYVQRKLLDTLGKDIIRFLIELITNSNDSYSRIEERNEREGKHDFVSGKIFITVNEKKDNNGKKYQEISVTDFAEGMSKDRIVQIFHEQQYGSYNAGGANDIGLGKGLRGFFGQGLSDVLRRAIKNNKPAQIESICDGMYTIMYYGPGKNGDRYGIQIATEPIFENSERRKKLGIEKNGTKVTFGVPDEVDFGPKVRKGLRESIEKCPTLRYLLDNPSRQVFLGQSIESSNFEGKLSSSKYRFGGDVLYDEDGSFPFRGKIKKYHLKIYRKTNLDDEAKIIVRDEYYAVYANTQFRANNFQDFVGELEIIDLRDIVKTELRTYEQEIFKDNRTGFNTDHEFFVSLNNQINPILTRLSEKTNNDSISAINNKNLNQGISELNKYVKDSTQEENIGGNFAGKEPPASGIKFGIKNSNLIITKDKTTNVKLLINASMINPDDEINISLENNNGNIDVAPLSFSYGNTKVSDTGLVTKTISIYGNGITEKPVIITAKCGNYSDKLYVGVIDEEIMHPENGLKFSQDQYHSVFDKPHKIVLYFNSEMIPVGSIINIDAGGLTGKSVYKTTEENLISDSGIGKLEVVFEGGNEGDNFTVKASFGDIISTTEIILTSSKDQKSPSNGLISQVKFESFEDAQSRVQISFDSSTGTIYINKNNHINKKFLGNGNEIKLKEDMNWKQEQKQYFCDLLTDCIAKELVKKKRGFQKKGEVNFQYSEGDIADKIWEVQQKHKNEMFKILYPHLVKLSINSK